MLNTKMINGVVLAAVMMIALPVSAEGKIHLLFHIGQKTGSVFSVGGTLENLSTAVVSEGYVVIVPLDGQCYPGRPVMQTFGRLSPGHKVGFSVPVQGDYREYRLVSVGAVDDMGYALPVQDDTAAVITAREPQERRGCRAVRQSGAPRSGGNGVASRPPQL